jgi:hypothetical protein
MTYRMAKCQELADSKEGTDGVERRDDHQPAG